MNIQGDNITANSVKQVIKAIEHAVTNSNEVCHFDVSSDPSGDIMGFTFNEDGLCAINFTITLKR